MRPRTRHARLVDAACMLYGLAIRMYPTGFRRDFGHELAITFRNRAEDVLDAGMVASFAFAVHIAFDWLRTWATWPTEPTVQDSASLLGLREGYMALGYLDRTGVDRATGRQGRLARDRAADSEADRCPAIEPNAVQHGLPARR